MKMTAWEKSFVNSTNHTREVADRALKLLNRIEHRPGWRYLDVGCGVGAGPRAIAGATGLAVTGVDLDPQQIDTARSGERKSNLDFKVMDAASLEFPDAEFDIVATAMATHHIPNWERAVEEMIRVLRPGGYLIYTDFSFPAWLAKFARLGRRLTRFIGFPSAKGLDSLTAKAGLVKVHALRRTRRMEFIWLKKG
jgi:ubiquinone/menaquinone biosynthesis C-methylase UbiE